MPKRNAAIQKNFFCETYALEYFLKYISTPPPSYNLQEAKFLDLFISTDALHVSGGSSAHHQEHITVHTASGIVQFLCS